MVGARLCGLVAMAALGCGGGGPADPDAAPTADAAPFSPGLGATFAPDGATLHVRVVSANATRMELWLYDAPLGDAAGRHPMTREPGTDVWSAAVPAPDGVVYYGLRAWGPNWPYDPAWEPGTEIGFIEDVDADGHRFNPNKLLIDPYALEISHDPVHPEHTDGRIYLSGDGDRGRDAGPVAPKSIALRPGQIAVDTGPRPGASRGDHIIYEVHLRGLTRADDDLACAGTYAGAAARADYLAELGVTVIELLPVQETQNDANDVEVGAGGDNYWGYSTLAYFAPDRRYSCDRTPGGPTREFREMVAAFHARGIEVWIDVVYNHTAEGGAGSGGTRSPLYSLRGLDNATYYQLSADGRGFTDHTGIGANVDATSPHVRDLVLDSLRYWHEEMGVDGFRFDLAPVLANRCERGCFEFDPDDPDGILLRALAELPGADLVAEPWAIGPGTYQLGAFPPGWAQWNDRFRETIRRRQNRVGVDEVTPRELLRRLAGSPDVFGGGQGAVDSVNYIVSHDGFTLHDLYACNAKDNDQPWPYGPSDGGDDHNVSWDHGGDPVRQRQAARTGLALLMLSTGPAMITGGDEMLRSQRCNNNPYNLDSPGNWLDWERLTEMAAFHTFTRRLIAYRRAHPEAHRGGRVVHRPDGQPAGDGWLDDPGNRALAVRAGAHYLAYNAGTQAVAFTLPEPAAGRAWHRVADTGAWMEPQDNVHAPGDEYRMNGRTYEVGPRALALFREQ
jgi:isoamylase